MSLSNHVSRPSMSCSYHESRPWKGVSNHETRPWMGVSNHESRPWMSVSIHESRPLMGVSDTGSRPCISVSNTGSRPGRCTRSRSTAALRAPGRCFPIRERLHHKVDYVLFTRSQSAAMQLTSGPYVVPIRSRHPPSSGLKGPRVVHRAVGDA